MFDHQFFLTLFLAVFVNHPNSFRCTGRSCTHSLGWGIQKKKTFSHISIHCAEAGKSALILESGKVKWICSSSRNRWCSKFSDHMHAQRSALSRCFFSWLTAQLCVSVHWRWTGWKHNIQTNTFTPMLKWIFSATNLYVFAPWTIIGL